MWTNKQPKEEGTYQALIMFNRDGRIWTGLSEATYKDGVWEWFKDAEDFKVTAWLEKNSNTGN
jgi:hypothetical protein